MANFAFISGRDFRKSLESDYAELIACRSAGAWKAVHVLSGSIIEAVLIDYLVASDYQKRHPTQDPLRFDLNQCIVACKAENALTSRSADLSSVIRQYRNLIHPGRTIRLKEQPDENGAMVAIALLEMIVEQVAAQKRETYGYTAEQITQKIEIDASVMAILEHLLKDTKEFEIERLLLEIMPSKYFEWLERDYPDATEEVTRRFEICFRAAFEAANDDLKRKATRQFVRILKEDGEHRVLRYETAFFRASDLDYLDSDDVRLVKKHLLSQLGRSLTVALLRAAEGIGKHLVPEDANEYVDPLLRAVTSTRAEVPRAMILDHARNECWLTSAATEAALVKRVEVWIAHNAGRNRSDAAQICEEFKIAIAVPF